MNSVNLQAFFCFVCVWLISHTSSRTPGTFNDSWYCKQPQRVSCSQYFASITWPDGLFHDLRASKSELGLASFMSFGNVLPPILELLQSRESIGRVISFVKTVSQGQMTANSFSIRLSNIGQFRPPLISTYVFFILSTSPFSFHERIFRFLEVSKSVDLHFWTARNSWIEGRSCSRAVKWSVGSLASIPDCHIDSDIRRLIDSLATGSFQGWDTRLNFTHLGFVHMIKISTPNNV